MAKRACWREIPTELSLERFKEFILPHLTVGRRGPAPKLSLHALFNYILKLLYLGCQWKELPTEKDANGRGSVATLVRPVQPARSGGMTRPRRTPLVRQDQAFKGRQFTAKVILESMQSCGVHYGANATALSSFAGRKPG